MSRKAWQLSIFGTWTLFAVAYTWNFYTHPPHDEEYGRWLFLSLMGTAGPWIYCSIPLVLVTLSIDNCYRRRRTWMTIGWIVVMTSLAYVKIHAFYSAALIGLDMHWASPIEVQNFRVEVSVEHFANDWLFPALLVLAAFLWIEKKLTNRGLLT